MPNVEIYTMPAANHKSLTIVIPTRERSDTLLYTIKTCVAQSYENLTILIVDNFSQDDTSAIVKSFSDQRISYINSGRRLSMSVNWEFALSQVESDYVMFLGDDDGVLPGAVLDLMALVADTESVDAITWPSVDYGWPSCPNQYLRNIIVIPLGNGIERRRTAEVLSDVISFKRPYSELPFIYKGLVKTEAVKKLRAASGGTVFHSMIPDVYFGISSCAVIDNYLYSFRPYTLNGASSHSNGTASFSRTEGKKAEQIFLAEDNIKFHSTLLFCPSIPILVTESLLQAKLRLSSLEKYSIDIDATVTAAIAQLKRAEVNVFVTVMAALHHISKAEALRPETKHALASASNRPFYATERVFGIDIFNKRYVVNCNEFEIEDCFAATIQADFVLKLNRNNQLSIIEAVKNGAKLIRRELTKRKGWFQ